MRLEHLQGHWDDGATQVEVDETVLDCCQYFLLNYRKM